jgi:hypothetical protein
MKSPAIHCHGTVFAPGRPIEEAMITLNYVQVHDHFVKRNYYGSVPGFNACDCGKNMPFVHRSDVSMLNKNLYGTPFDKIDPSSKKNFNAGTGNNLANTYKTYLGDEAFKLLQNPESSCKNGNNFLSSTVYGTSTYSAPFVSPSNPAYTSSGAPFVSTTSPAYVPSVTSTPAAPFVSTTSPAYVPPVTSTPEAPFVSTSSPAYIPPVTSSPAAPFVSSSSPAYIPPVTSTPAAPFVSTTDPAYSSPAAPFVSSSPVIPGYIPPVTSVPAAPLPSQNALVSSARGSLRTSSGLLFVTFITCIIFSK